MDNTDLFGFTKPTAMTLAAYYKSPSVWRQTIMAMGYGFIMAFFLKLSVVAFVIMQMQTLFFFPMFSLGIDHLFAQYGYGKEEN